MIPDEVLKKLADGLHPKLCGDPKYEDGEVEPVITDMASEILSIREQKRKLVEDGKRLAKQLSRLYGYCSDEFGGVDKEAQSVLDQHNVLMEEIKR